MKDMKEWLIRLVLIIFGFIIPAFALEFGLSKFAPSPQTSPRGFHEKDEYIGWKGIPNKEIKWVEGRIVSYVKMNSHGFRDRERNYEKGKDVFRIVVLGDSYTEGVQVPLEQTFPYILEEKLNSEKSGKRFEVLNLGVEGFGTAQEYLTLKHYGLRYHPDLVILAFYINNDVLDNSLILDSKFRGRSIDDLLRFRPYLVLNNGKLEELPFKVKDRKDEEQTKRGASGRFQILHFLEKLFPNIYYSLVDRINETPWLANFLWKISAKKSKPALPDKSKENGLPIGLSVYAEEYTPEWQNAWEVTKALILKLAEELEMNKIGFLVVTIPHLDKLQPDKFELPRNRDKYPQQGAFRFDLGKPDRILSNFLEANKIDYLLLRPELKKYIKETGKDLHFQYNYEDHWNANGHALAAQLIYKKLKEGHLVPLCP